MSTGAVAIGRMKESITIRRYGVGSYVDGKWVEGAISTFSTEASIQPINPREQLLLPEGVRERGSIKLYLTTKLKTVDEDTKQDADEITYNGSTYEVFQVSNYRMGILDHFKVIALRLSK